MSEIKTRADLFEAAAKMMRMCDEAGIPYVCKVCGNKIIESNSDFVTFCGSPSSYEFPIAILEGRPVFVGDELWGEDGRKHKIFGLRESGFIDGGASGMFSKHFLSWNPPKTRTVMVEMLREDAEACTTNYAVVRIDRIADACRKALENPINIKSESAQEEKTNQDINKAEAVKRTKEECVKYLRVFMRALKAIGNDSAAQTIKSAADGLEAATINPLAHISNI